MNYIHTIVEILLQSLASWGYTGIVLLMALESSLLPVPSELVMIPAGYLAAQGKMNPMFLVLAGAVGSVLGALFNYFCALYFGRAVFLRFGKYVGIGEHHIERVEQFFYRHGEVSTFVGRLLPVIRHLISIPAGFARMSLWKLVLFTSIGSGLWCTVLVSIGYFAGTNPDLQKDLLAKSSTYLIIMVCLLIGAYIIYDRKNPKNTHRISVSSHLIALAKEGHKIGIVSDHGNIKKKDSIFIVNDEGDEVRMAILKTHSVKSEAQVGVFLMKEILDHKVVEKLQLHIGKIGINSVLYFLAPINKIQRK